MIAMRQLDATTGHTKPVRVTAKQLAAEIVIRSLQSSFYWHENRGWNEDEMTDREKEEISRHVDILVDRLRDKLAPILPPGSIYRH
jgi:hypothetical protein